MVWVCNSCVGKNRSDKISKQLIAQWEDQTYRIARIETTAKLLQDENFKAKHKSSLSGKLEVAPALESGMSDAIKRRWLDSEYRSKVMAGISSEEAKLKLAAHKQTTEFVIGVAKSRLEFKNGRPSQPHLALYNYLDALNVEYIKEGPDTVFGHYSFDCLVPNKKLLIEVQGDYWHSLQKTIAKDSSKFAYMQRYFPEYEIMYVWEHEFYAKDGVIDRLKSKIGMVVNSVDFAFEDVVISKSIPYQECNEFLNVYHYLSKSRGGVSFGCYLGGILIAIAVYSPPLRQHTARQFDLADNELVELSRFCIHPNYHKHNFATWFLARTLKKLDFKAVVSYADTTIGHAGTIYKASNFTLHHEVAPDYWYISELNYPMHKRTLYARACKMSLTEAEFATRFGYIRRWGGKKLCFIKYL